MKFTDALMCSLGYHSWDYSVQFRRTCRKCSAHAALHQRSAPDLVEPSLSWVGGGGIAREELYYYLAALRMQFLFFFLVQLPLLWLGSWWLILALLLFVGQLLDVRSRMAEFRRIRESHEKANALLRPKVARRWLDRQKHAPCRRDAAGAAIRDVGFAKKYYRELGYRWWHLLPDDLFRRATTLEYWKAALFKSY